MKGSMKKIQTHLAPSAIGPYSQGVILDPAKPLIFVSGQLPIDPATGRLLEGGISLQTHRVIDHIEAILKAAGSSLAHVLRVEIFLKDLARDFPVVNAEYAKRFTGEPQPARQTIQAAELPLGAPIEISCIAYREEER